MRREINLQRGIILVIAKANPATIRITRATITYSIFVLSLKTLAGILETGCASIAFCFPSIAQAQRPS